MKHLECKQNTFAVKALRITPKFRVEGWGLEIILLKNFLVAYPVYQRLPAINQFLHFSAEKFLKQYQEGSLRKFHKQMAIKLRWLSKV